MLAERSVWGGATETVLACDLIAAAASAALAVTPATLGVVSWPWAARVC